MTKKIPYTLGDIVCAFFPSPAVWLHGGRRRRSGRHSAHSDFWNTTVYSKVPPALRKWLGYWEKYCLLFVPMWSLLTSFVILLKSFLYWNNIFHLDYAMNFICNNEPSSSFCVLPLFYIICLVAPRIRLTENGSIYGQ